MSRIRRRHRRGLIGSAWIVITPAAMFLLYWAVFGLGFQVVWQEPQSERSVGYIAPFAIGYSLYLFLATAVTGSASGLQSTASIWKNGGVNLNVVVASFGLEFLIRLAIYLGLAAALVALTGPALTLSGGLGFVGYLLLFIGQALALGAALMVLTPFFADLAEASSLGLRVFIYAAGLTFPLAIYPPPLQEALMLMPLTGPLNAARDALLFATPQPWGLILIWIATTLSMLALAGLLYSRLRRRVIDVF